MVTAFPKLTEQVVLQVRIDRFRDSFEVDVDSEDVDRPIPAGC